jgi:uncharacterized protein (TIGR03437 family)
MTGTAGFVFLLPALTTAIWGSTVRLSLAPPAGEAGASLVVPVILETNGQAVSALQFDLAYDAETLDIRFRVAEGVRVAAKRVYLVDPGSNQKRLLVTGLNRNAVPDGVLLQAYINIRPDAALGPTLIAFTGLAAAGPDGQVVPLWVDNTAVVVEPAGLNPIALQMEGVLNGASLLPGPVAPGEVITLIGSSLGTELANTRVLWNGVPAPLLYAAPSQINVAVPYAVAGAGTAVLVVESQGYKRAELTLPVERASPGLFTSDGTGAGQGLILNEDSTPNSPSNPAARGSLITLFGTGAGEMEGEGEGRRPRLPVSAQIGGVEAEVVSSAPLAGLAADVLRIVCRVPGGSTPAFDLPVVWKAGTFASQSSVTIAVK